MSENGRGKYLYCVLRTAKPLEFPFAGANGAEERVHTIHADDLAVAASDSGAESYDVTRSAMMGPSRSSRR